MAFVRLDWVDEDGNVRLTLNAGRRLIRSICEKQSIRRGGRA